MAVINIVLRLTHLCNCNTHHIIRVLTRESLHPSTLDLVVYKVFIALLMMMIIFIGTES